MNATLKKSLANVNNVMRITRKKHWNDGEKKKKKPKKMFSKTIMMFSIFLTFLKTLVQLKSIHDNVLDNVIDVGRVDVQVP